ncbi:ABC transporter permease subunit [Deinococcus cellulosilyticus]|uniref:ABC transmembrane type-1 domain-containing protein n=1 Tax=Deinococcus cellulosilyticus (strain DSM 18568 / NBRC 106333 / KACC 11606 / 5516J-15) TaxID=1223518 RepID=A0A511MUZ0_DEIC1|nr:ABC transporter permease subunit [Deinococcus cellulosilyticus]GEM44409.1 hypothetical protein DC3_00440 [Deinococcus cellulosilyticus NBRC 106333 = KACC 11606]
MKRTLQPKPRLDHPALMVLALTLLLVVCALLSWLVVEGLSALSGQKLPTWISLLAAGLLMVPVAVVVNRRLPGIRPWMYLLPATLFLVAFTGYPLAMTVYYSFTNYSAAHSGRPDSSTQMGVTRSGNTLQLGEATTQLRCPQDQCAGQILEIQGQQAGKPVTLKAEIAAVQGQAVTLSDPLPADFIPTVVRRINKVSWVGTQNYERVLGSARTQLFPLLGWNILYALITTGINLALGAVLGILLHNKKLRGRNFYRSILILPWAIPGIISIQVWQTLLNTNFGAVNRLLGMLGVTPAPWLEDPLWAKTAIVMVSLWMSFPYFMTATLSALSTIPEELYEAAEVDGATAWDRLRFITIPLLSTSFVPIALSAFASGFNNITLIFLLTGGGPAMNVDDPTAQSTDILLSWAYKTAFVYGGGEQYGLASAIAVVIGVITVLISVVNFSVSGVFSEARNTESQKKGWTLHLSPQVKTVLWWTAGLITVFFTVKTAINLKNSLGAPSFAIHFQAGGWFYLFLGFVVLVALISGVMYLLSRKQKRTFQQVFLGTLTHAVLCMTVLAVLYPVVYVLAASFDPLNRLSQASLGGPEEPLLIRARVLPSLTGLDLTNYKTLFNGVQVQTWQWVMLAFSVVCFVLMQVQKFTRGMTQNMPAAQKRESWAGILTVVFVALFLVTLMPSQFTTENPASKFLLWVRNTLLISGFTGLVTLALTTTAGYALARMQFKGRMQYLMVIIFLQMFPGLLGLIAIYSLMNTLGLVNTFTGLILAYTGGIIAFATWIYKGYVESLPHNLNEAALVDGCTPWQAFTRIILPLSGPMLVFIFLLQFIGSYAEYFLANVLLTGAENWNIGVGLRSFASNQFTVQYGPFTAASVLGALPIVILFFTFQKIFVSGATSGAVKE